MGLCYTGVVILGFCSLQWVNDSNKDIDCCTGGLMFSKL